jgi:hypothetical protein
LSQDVDIAEAGSGCGAILLLVPSFLLLELQAPTTTHHRMTLTGLFGQLLLPRMS